MASREEIWAQAYWELQGHETEYEDRPAFVRELHRRMEEISAQLTKEKQERYRRELIIQRKASAQDEQQYFGAATHWSYTGAR